MKKIAIVFNGGTISMKFDEKANGAVPSLSNEEILSMVPNAEKYANIESFAFSSLPSPHVTPSLMLELSKFVKKLVDRDDIDGVVITHGTDTLEETAYMLELTIDTKKPIVITGAMRNSSELGYDGGFNLANSICTAISDEAFNRGVLVCFNGELNSASEAVKVNSMALSAFQTPTFGPIGIVDDNKVIFYRNSPKVDRCFIDKLSHDVALIKCVSGMDSSFIDFAIDKGYEGIIIEALGRGNVPKEMVYGIKRAIDKNVKVVMVSRCFKGRVLESYGYEGGGRMLRDLGVIFGDNMQGQKARIKLLVALNKNNDFDFVKNYFEKGLYNKN